MCGRFAFYSPSEATAALFGAAGAIDLEPRFNIAPTQYIAAIRNSEDDGRELTTLRWGLIPFWAKDPSIGNRMINARAETVAEKPAYRAAYRRRRCLVLADGFYEWKKAASGKTPYLISLASGSPFALAGLWEHWQSKETDESIDSATLITTDANDFMAQLHQRMPVILEPDTADRWLAGDDELLEYAASHPPQLKAWPVDRRVNNARNEGQDLIEPVGAIIES
ncbi:MAG: SOS response-associated peptidase [Gammaproteobacteria bacterium]|nr:SOS response-associated peptidase [Gammaproteobacteria bacterium]